MNTDQIAEKVIYNTNYHESQFPLEQFWGLISEAHEEIYNQISSYLDKNYSFDIWKVKSATKGQSEFSLLDSYQDQNGDRIAGQDRIEKVLVKYSKNSGYIPCTPTTFEFVGDFDELAQSQSPNNPLCIIADGSVFIFPSLPAPIIDGDDREVGVKLYGSRKPYPLKKGMSKKAIFVPELYHHLIVLNATYKVRKKKRNYEEANQWKVDYTEEMYKSLNQLQAKMTTTVIGRPLSHRHLE